METGTRRCAQEAHRARENKRTRENGTEINERERKRAREDKQTRGTQPTRRQTQTSREPFWHSILLHVKGWIARPRCWLTPQTTILAQRLRMFLLVSQRYPRKLRMAAHDAQRLLDGSSPEINIQKLQDDMDTQFKVWEKEAAASVESRRVDPELEQWKTAASQ